jgi:hypothetical protein
MIRFSQTMTIVWISVAALSVFFFGIALVDLIGNGLGSLSAGFSRLFRKWLGPVHRIIPKFIHANTRKIKNMVGTMIIGASMVTTVIITANSIISGEVKGMRTFIGGDVTIFNPIVNENDIPSIRAIPGVAAATITSYLLMNTWNANKPITSYLVNKLGSCGGVHDNVMENINLMVIDVPSYLDVNDNDNSIFRLDSNLFETTSQFVHRLDTPYSIILQRELAGETGTSTGSTLPAELSGFQSLLSVVGTAKLLPGAGHMVMYDSPPDPGEMVSKTRTAIISRDTIESILAEFSGNIDIMIKNMSALSEIRKYTNESIPQEELGYTSGRVSKSSVTAALAGVSGIDKIAFRFSTFVPAAPNITIQYNASRVVNRQSNATVAKGGIVSLPNRLYTFDSTDEYGMTSDQGILDTHYWVDSIPMAAPGDPISRIRNGSVSDVMYAYDTRLVWDPGLLEYNSHDYFGDNSICVMNKYVTMYDSPSNQSWVYQINEGDVVTVHLNSTRSFNFTVVATVDTHAPYFFNNFTQQQGIVFNGKTLNYNFNTNGSNVANRSFYEIFDADANVFLTTYKQMFHMAQVMTGFPIGYDVDDLVNHAYVKVTDGFDPVVVAETIETELSAHVFNGDDYSAFAYKHYLIEKLGQIGILEVRKSPGYSDDEVIENLRTWYIAHGYEWRKGSVRTPSTMENIGYFGSVVDIFFTIVLFTLIISSIGLAATVYSSVQSRTRQYGVMKAIGFDDTTIHRMVFMESFMVSFIGAIFGIITAIVSTWMLFDGLSSSMFLPIYFEIPWLLVGTVIGFLVLVTIISSQIIASHVSRQTVAQNIRYRE